MSPYDRMLALVEREAELIANGDWESLVGLGDERRAVLAELPPQAPAGAAGLLRLLAARLDSNAAALAAALAQTRGELDRIGRSRKALGSYAQPAPSRLELRG